MSYLIILGIVFIAIGLYITYSGSKKDNDESQKQIAEKLDTFNKKLNTATQSNLDPVNKQKKFDNIKSEFDSWAENLKTNQRELSLSHEQSILNRSQKKNDLNKTWSPIFAGIFNDLIKMIKSINKEFPSNEISIYQSSPIFPSFIFDTEAKKYFQVFGFNKTTFLRVNIFRSEHADIPSVDFTLYKDFEHAKNDTIPVGNQISIGFKIGKTTDKNTFYISTSGELTNFEFDFENSGTKSCSVNYLTDLLKRIVEFHFLLSNK